MPGRPAALNEVLSVPPVRRLDVATDLGDAEVGEPRHGGAEHRGGFRRAEHRQPADASRAAVDVDVAVKQAYSGFGASKLPKCSAT